MSYKEKVHDMATLLLATDHVWMDDMPLESALEFARGIVEAVEIDPQWSDGKHCGDCTKEAHTCCRCHFEEYEKEARERMEDD